MYYPSLLYKGTERERLLSNCLFKCLSYKLIMGIKSCSRQGDLYKLVCPSIRCVVRPFYMNISAAFWSPITLIGELDDELRWLIADYVTSLQSVGSYCFCGYRVSQSTQNTCKIRCKKKDISIGRVTSFLTYVPSCSSIGWLVGQLAGKSFI